MPSFLTTLTGLKMDGLQAQVEIFAALWCSRFCDLNSGNAKSEISVDLSMNQTSKPIKILDFLVFQILHNCKFP